MFVFLFFTGAIFTQDDKDSTTEVAFKYAVYRINKDKAVLPNTTLVYDIEYVSPQDSFDASKKGTIHRNSRVNIVDLLDSFSSNERCRKLSKLLKHKRVRDELAWSRTIVKI